jgi:hypothetical protein
VFEVLVGPENVHRYYEDGEPTGYLVRRQGEDAVVCLEVGYRGDDRASFLTATWNLLVEAVTDEVERETATATSLTDEDSPGETTSIRWDPPLDALAGALRATGHDLRTETMRERTGETPMLWAAPDLLDAATGGAFDSAEAVGERVVGPDRWFPALDKF